MASGNGEKKRQVKILYVLAKDGPLNPYKTWAKLVKEDLATQPTIRTDLEEMNKIGIVKIVRTEEKVRGGKPSPYYELTLQGLATVIWRYDLLGDKVENARQFASHVAKKYHDLWPEVFDLWPAFIRAKVDKLASDIIRHSSQMAFYHFNDTGEPTPAHLFSRVFFDTIIRALVNPTGPHHDAWLRAVGEIQALARILLTKRLSELADEIEDANQFLVVLPHQKPSIFESNTLEKLNNELERFRASMNQVYGRAPE